MSTIQYPDLDRKMALKLGRTRDASRVDLTMMKRLADKTDVDPTTIYETVQQTLTFMRDSWPKISPDLPVGRSFHDRLRVYQQSVPLLQSFAI